MKIGELYSCKWKNRTHNTDRPNVERGWDMLLFLGQMNGDESLYRFLDMLSGEECVLVKALVRHCKEIPSEEQCTQ